jgi:(5-formylfuran-3-yl)methyl phosphate synthase
MNSLAARAPINPVLPLMLASVTSPAEARICLSAGADLIDAKDPSAGALGALPVSVVAAIAAEIAALGLPRMKPVSATIGDLPMAPEPVCNAVTRMAATGVDYVKIGFQGGGERRAVICRLAGCHVGKAQLVGVLFADQDLDLDLIEIMADVGFAGVMLDTADKKAGSISRILNIGKLAEFIGRAHESRLFAGLAGSLRLRDIDVLAPLGPDILGFRGALCLDSDRIFAIDERAVAAVRSQIDEVSATRSRAGG